MNTTILAGRVYTIPKLSVIQIEENSMYVCKFVIGVPDGQQDEASEEVLNQNAAIDFFECIAFDDMAKKIIDRCEKSAKIIVKGKFKNFLFEDYNKTPHYTNVFLVTVLEFADTKSAFMKKSNEKRYADSSIFSDVRLLDDRYELLCKNGFLCVNEDDYYTIATDKMHRN